MREYLFRGKRVDNGEWVYGDLVRMPTNGGDYSTPPSSDLTTYITDSKILSHDWIPVIPETVGQYTNIVDENRIKIFEGDTIRWRKPYRTTQTHYGDNIPNGAYTEPMEPGIKTYESTVMFKDGSFGVETQDMVIDTIDIFPWIDTIWDEFSIREAIRYRRDGSDIWDDPEEGDLQYLLEEYKLKDLPELINYLSGIEIIGSIHDNPELLQTNK